MFLIEYLEINWDMISTYYRNTIPDLTYKHLHFVGRSQLNDKTLRYIVAEYAKMEGQLVEEAYKVDKKKKKRQELVDKQQSILAELKSSKCFSCNQITYHLTQYDVAKTYKKQLDDIQKVLAGGVDEKESEFNTRTAVLTQYKIVDNELNLLFKGKVAAKVSSVDSILLTEFFFSGLINELTDQELLAVLSILNNQQKAGK